MFNFFQKPFGLDISDSSIELISLNGSLARPNLLAMSRINLESGIFENGKILKKPELIKLILNLVSKPRFGKIKKRECIFSLPDSKVFLHFFELPSNFKKNEILEKIKITTNENFPYPLEELYWDFTIISNKEVLIVACPKEIVSDYLDVLKLCKIKPIVLEPESESLVRSLTKKEEKTVLIIDIGSRTTNFSLVDNNKLKFSFLLSLAGEKFTSSISQNLKISLAEAENIKIKKGLNPNNEEGRVFLILQQEFREIIEEIKRIENYFKEKTGKSIEKIILTGGSAQMPYLSDYLNDNLGKRIEVGDPWDKINISLLQKKEYLKEALKLNPVLFSNVIGLALRGLCRQSNQAGINLIKKIK